MTNRRICLPYEDRHMGGSYIASLPILVDSNGRNSGRIIAATHNSGPWTDYLDKHNLSNIRLAPLTVPGRDGGFWKTVPSFALQSLRLAAFIRRHDIKIVHANEESIGVAWLPACRLTGAKLIWQQHGIPTPSRILRFMRRRSDILIAVSDFTNRLLVDEGRGADATVLNSFSAENLSGQSSDGERMAIRKRLELPADRPIIAFVGALTEQKRPLLLIEAMRHVMTESAHRPKVLMFGDNRSSMKAALTAAAGTGESTVDFTLMGFREDLHEWLRATDILAAPAIGEGFGRALIDAMMAGATVIASASGGHCEIIDHGMNGLLVEPDDATALCKAVIHLLDNKALREKLAQTAHDEAHHRFSTAEYAETFEKIYAAVQAGTFIRRDLEAQSLR